MRQALPAFQRFVTSDYNLLLYFLYAQDYIVDFHTYLSALTKLTKDDFLVLLEKQFGQANLHEQLSNLDKLPIQERHKWYLFSLMNDFEQQLQELIASLHKQYDVYCFYADTLANRYEPSIQQLENQCSQSDQLYPLLFNDILSPKEFQQVHQAFILLSSHQLLVHYKKDHQFVAVGLHVYDYYLALEKQRTLDQVTMQHVLKVLADPIRYGIMKCIEKGMTSNKEIAKIFSISPSGVTYQTKFLLENQILLIDPETKRYVLNQEIIRLALHTVLAELNITPDQIASQT